MIVLLNKFLQENLIHFQAEKKIYFSGNSFVNFQKAKFWRDSLQSIGINDAFVRAFRNNKFLSVQASLYTIKKAQERNRNKLLWATNQQKDGTNKSHLQKSKLKNKNKGSLSNRKKAVITDKLARENRVKGQAGGQKEESNRKEIDGKESASNKGMGPGPENGRSITQENSNKSIDDENSKKNKDKILVINEREKSNELNRNQEQTLREESKDKVDLSNESGEGQVDIRTKESVLSNENKAKKDIKNKEETVTATTSNEMVNGLQLKEELEEKEKREKEIGGIEKELVVLNKKKNEQEVLETNLKSEMADMIKRGVSENEMIDMEMKLHEALIIKEEQEGQEVKLKEKIKVLTIEK